MSIEFTNIIFPVKSLSVGFQTGLDVFFFIIGVQAASCSSEFSKDCVNLGAETGNVIIWGVLALSIFLHKKLTDEKVI